MGWMDFLLALDIWNATALGLFLACWLLYPWVGRLVHGHDLTTEIVKFRIHWLQQMLSREDRITDISLARGLFSSVMFQASTSILLIGGLLGILGSATYIHTQLEDSAWLEHTGLALFETRIVLLILIQVHSFFKFTWSMRLHSYTTVLIGSAPPPAGRDSPVAQRLVSKGAELSGLASQSYFSGLRGYYFGLAALTWFIGPGVFILATLVTLAVLIRREYFSRALKVIQEIEEDKGFAGG